jgi:hypothetical protein
MKVQRSSWKARWISRVADGSLSTTLASPAGLLQMVCVCTVIERIAFTNLTCFKSVT